MNKLNVLPQNPELSDEEKAVGLGRFPSWLHRKMPTGCGVSKTSSAISSQRLFTVCEEAKCPNQLECWSRKTATFLALGKECTRACPFCDIDFSKKPKAPEPDEPLRIAESAKELGLKHVVITMVARDDLEDGGAEHIAKIVKAIREVNEGATVELLTSDFNGNQKAWEIALASHPEIFNYNIETVRSLTPKVRHTATYERTLEFLRFLSQSPQKMFIKSGLMLGLGETKEEVHETLRDLKEAGVDIVTMGQYLQADRLKLRVKEFIHPDQFNAYRNYGLEMGISYIYAGPFIRSSYNADTILKEISK